MGIVGRALARQAPVRQRIEALRSAVPAPRQRKTGREFGGHHTQLLRVRDGPCRMPTRRGTRDGGSLGCVRHRRRPGSNGPSNAPNPRNYPELELGFPSHPRPSAPICGPFHPSWASRLRGDARARVLGPRAGSPGPAGVPSAKCPSTSFLVLFCSHTSRHKPSDPHVLCTSWTLNGPAWPGMALTIGHTSV